MPPARRPEFEPAFGSLPTDAKLATGQADPPGEVAPSAPSNPPLVDPPAGSSSTPVADPLAGSPAGPEGMAELGGTEPTIETSTASAQSEPAVPAPAAPDLPTAPTLPERPHADPAPPAPEPVDAHDSTPTDGAPRPAGLRWFNIRKRIVAACAIAVLIGVAYYFVSLFQVWSTGRADDSGPVDAIVVMGAAQYDGRPSPQLAARLDHTLELWPEGVAPLVVVTGGNIPGDRFTEAQASATYLAERGVPLDALLLENEGSNSYESLDAVADLLAARGLDEVLIVTDPYHALRSRLIAEEVGLDASVSSTNTSVVTGGESWKRHFEEAAGVAAGRIIGFDRLTRLVD